MVSKVESAGAAERVLSVAEKEGVRFVNLQFTDIVGVVKSVTIPVHQLPNAIEHGVWFDGSSIEGFARIAESDMYLELDLDTFAVVPWEGGDASGNKTARIICDVYTPDGELFEGSPRSILKRAMAEAEELGFVFKTGPEPEFFLFKQDEQGHIAPLPHDQGGYFDLTTDLASSVRQDMVNALEALAIKVEASHHEVAVGQHEIDFEYGPALHTADNVVTFKYTLKAVANAHGLHATFMPKPIFGINGSGMHVHQSLFDKASGDNAFYDASSKYGLSEVALQFIAGQLTHARGMSAVLAPLVNSYKRLVPGYEAPVYISWARINRSALIRVPRISPGKPRATRVELRCPDPSCNPYLAFAVMLRAGLDGIKRGLIPPEPVEENLYELDDCALERRSVSMLPGSLNEALAEMERDPLVAETLGEHIYSRFLEAKKSEWDEYRMRVSQWELERYLEIF